mmetsp:Transcript_15854/g.32537  ORF Transcript_15854/g.32537 Transcript_15854/m.32537 type:complete len:259 (-) Transcript_15854:115-891(-)
MDRHNNEVGLRAWQSMTRVDCTFRIFGWCLTRKERVPSTRDVAHKIAGKLSSAVFATETGQFPDADTLVYVKGEAIGVRICFEEIEGSSQCQGTRASCSVPSNAAMWTMPFRDDTDNRGGGCKYRWRVENVKPTGRKEYRLCFREVEGSSQCGGTRSSCTAWGDGSSWTAPFRDDTANRGGGCTYQWIIEEREASGGADVSSSSCQVCFHETEGSSQCQGTDYTCSGPSTAPAWTEAFRDDTDKRSGGCKYSWSLRCP